MLPSNSTYYRKSYLAYLLKYVGLFFRDKTEKYEIRLERAEWRIYLMKIGYNHLLEHRALVFVKT